MDYIIEVSMESTLEEIYEGLKTTIPSRIKKDISTRSSRIKLLEQFGKDSFLLPDKLKFPVKDPKTGEYDCRLLYAAYIRARQYSKSKSGYTDIAAKAKQLLNDLGCKGQIGVQIEGIQDDLINLDILLDNILISD